MALTREQKEAIVEKVQTLADESPTVVFVNFHGLSVDEQNEMRNRLREEEVGYTVTKKSLAKLALGKVDIDGELPVLEGELALAYATSSDTETTAPARGVYQFQEDHEEKVAIMGGIFKGEYKDQEKMLSIARIPSLDTLRGQFVQLINSPIQRLAMVTKAIAEAKEA